MIGQSPSHVCVVKLLNIPSALTYKTSSRYTELDSSILKDGHQRVAVEGMASGQVPVYSGAPHGSVLGLLLFILHINDLPNVVTSHVRLFADDCLLYRPIRYVVDQEGFQRDLEALEQWATTGD